jgi:hypothetical protein
MQIEAINRRLEVIGSHQWYWHDPSWDLRQPSARLAAKQALGSEEMARGWYGPWHVPVCVNLRELGT